MKHGLSFDIEAWFDGNYIGHDPNCYRGKVDDRVVPETHRLLDLLDKKGYKATFFILGSVAEDHPKLVQEIYNRGHEIALHHWRHDLIYNKTPDTFRKELIQAKEFVENLIDDKVYGIRAPSWSISKRKTPWFWEILAEVGLLYSSSRFPTKNYLYGDPEGELFIHKINGIWELPPSCIKLLNFNIPFSGGFYFRAFPYTLTKLFFKKYEKLSKPVIFYLHPREIDSDAPVPRINLKEKIIYKYGIKSTLKKFSKLLDDFYFCPLKTLIENFKKECIENE